jgi:hypothetical protein
MKFKVGDRVKAIKIFEDNSTIINKLGTIKRVYDIYAENSRCLVRFDKSVNGHGDGLRNWNIDQNCLMLANGTIDLSHIKQYGIAKWIKKYYK